MAEMIMEMFMEGTCLSVGYGLKKGRKSREVNQPTTLGMCLSEIPSVREDVPIYIKGFLAYCIPMCVCNL